jgi:response regulator of citrate/malate metabolism/predicted RNA-binding Zn-ribbon protein involved in translation (DUF1610 family)
MVNTPSQKKDILIIEDSKAVSALLEEFLKKLDYQNIHICNTGRSGIQVFEELVKAEKIPLILLDYNLSDMNADDIMVEIFRIRYDAKIIIETASEKADESIKNVFRQGAYEYLEKPIRFENLKNIISVFEEEEKILNQKLESDPLSKSKLIDGFLRSSTQMSLARISQYCDMKKEDVYTYLKGLESNGKILQLDAIKEIACNQCSSVKIGETFHCPKCNISNFKRGKLIEHFKCGNVSLEESYKDSICPKCHKEIKTIGIDYRTMENYYFCNDCGEKFAEILRQYVCLRCNNKFKLEHAKWITSECFRPINL